MMNYEVVSIENEIEFLEENGLCYISIDVEGLVLCDDSDELWSNEEFIMLEIDIITNRISNLSKAHIFSSASGEYKKISNREIANRTDVMEILDIDDFLKFFYEKQYVEVKYAGDDSLETITEDYSLKTIAEEITPYLLEHDPGIKISAETETLCELIRIGILQNKIDAALDARDKDEFERLVKLL